MDYRVPFEIGFFGWIAFIGLHIWFNWRLIVKKKKTPSYWGNFLYRAFAAVICLFIMEPEFNPVWYPYTIWKAAPVLLYEVTSFYLLFDPFLNWSRGLVWHYRGKKSGWIDPSVNLRQYLILKGACLIMCVLAILNLFK
jgi:hypothetical protein